MATRSTRNQYRGINAHLHSLWQAEGGWDEFHTSHIVYLANALKAQLLPMGYTASIQQSLQIRRYGEPAGRPESDVTIYDVTPARRAESARGTVGQVGQLVIPIPALLALKEQDVEQYRAIGVYQYVPGKRERGEPVTWIELLSPSNKPGGQDSAYYHDKSLKIIRSGIVLVELDYLHESAPTFASLANYSQTVHPYRILVIDPRPELLKGQAQIYQFDVDDSIPVVNIPLSGSDVLSFDFGQPYHKTLAESLFASEVIYRELPVNFDRYGAIDQARIVARMLAVLDADQRGESLTNDAPFPVNALPLAEALQRLNTNA